MDTQPGLRIEIDQTRGVVNLMYGNECVDQMTISEYTLFRLNYHLAQLKDKPKCQ